MGGSRLRAPARRGRLATSDPIAAGVSCCKPLQIWKAVSRRLICEPRRRGCKPPPAAANDCARWKQVSNCPFIFLQVLLSLGAYKQFTHRSCAQPASNTVLRYLLIIRSLSVNALFVVVKSKIEWLNPAACMADGEVDNARNGHRGYRHIGEMRVDVTGTGNADEGHIGEQFYKGSEVSRKKRTYWKWTK